MGEITKIRADDLLNLKDVVLDYGSIIRAYNSKFAELDEQREGYDVAKFKDAVERLKLSCSLIVRASKEDVQDLLEVTRETYEGKPVLQVLTVDHKFVFLSEDTLSPVFFAVNIFVR